MILIHILSSDSKQIEEIADMLVDEKLILNAVTIEKTQVLMKAHDGNLVTQTQTLMMGKTKALLFNIIDKKLREKYEDRMPVIYSIPIVNMDWKQVDELVKETVQV